MSNPSHVTYWPDMCHGQWSGNHTAPVATVTVDPTPAQFRMKALELALAHWSTSTYPSVFAMADDLCAWLHRQRQEPKGE